MKIFQIQTAAFAIGFAAGCQQKSENQGGTSDTSIRSSGEERQNVSRDATRPGNPENKAVENTGHNIRDRAGDTLTPGDQGSSESDRELTRRIRRAITQNSQLSSSAKNIKIITVNGKVTLRGPVQNEGEARAIADAASSIAGAGSVENQLEPKVTN
jgi:osmotically-inducible protein OsmY